MNLNSTSILCDGCGLPASPDHLAARMQRLEWATRFRPVHIHLLFISLAPMPRLEDDFYGPPESRDFFDPFMSALGILPEAGKPAGESNGREAGTSRLIEFQRRGYYLTHLSECAPIAEHPANLGPDANAAREVISRLAPTLIKRIRFNYKPKHIALLGANLGALIEVFRQAGISSLLDFNEAAPLTVPNAGSTWSLP